MHVLLITSQELHENNTYHSVFELAQAKALKNAGLTTGILSIGLVSTRELLRSAVFRLLGRKDNYDRAAGKNFFQLMLAASVNIVRSAFRISQTRELNLEGITVFECVISKNPAFSLRKIPKSHWLPNTIKTAEKYFIKRGKPDLIHAHNRFMHAGQVALELKRKYNIPYLLTDHSSFYIRNLVKDEDVDEIIEGIKNAGLFSTVSPKLVSWINGRLQTNFSALTLPNALDVIFETAPVQPGKDNNTAFTYLIVAELNHNKGHHNLFKAFAEVQKIHPVVQLRVAGMGREFQKLQELAHSLGLKDKISFLGQLSLDNVRKEMLNCDCLVVSSEFETFGVVVIEALACGKPVISTKCGGPEDLINEENGILVPPNDPRALKDAMLSLLNTHSRYDSNKIRENCLLQFGNKSIVEKLLGAYHSVLEMAR